MSARPPPLEGREFIIETAILGAYARVVAVDAATGREAVVLVPAGAARADRERLALRKLERLLAHDPDPPRKGGASV